MNGLRKICRNNATQFAKEPGAYTAEAISIAAQLRPGDLAVFNATGHLPPIFADRALLKGFDDFQLAAELREVITNHPQLVLEAKAILRAEEERANA
jgi:hypothetical protein